MATKLFIPTEGPCAGHPCDNCRICRSGRCCRRDNPDYKLPGLGEWDGPIYGEIGKLEDDGEKVQCHCCGEFFVKIGHHLVVHDLTAEEYKSIFGLNRHRGLAAPAYLQTLSERGKRNKAQVQRMSAMAQSFLSSLTPEQRYAIATVPRRKEWRSHVGGNNRGAGGGPNTKLTRQQVIEILKTDPMPKTYADLRALAQQHEVHVESIKNIFQGKTWQDVGIELGFDYSKFKLERAPHRKLLRRKSDSKLTEGDVRLIRRLAPKTIREYERVAQQFGVCRATIQHVMSGRSWSWVDADEVAA